MTRLRKITGIILLSIGAVLLIWEAYVLIEKDHSATFSWVILEFTRNHPAVIFGAGFIAGHLIWPQKRG
jgi:hypothetical protein